MNRFVASAYSGIINVLHLVSVLFYFLLLGFLIVSPDYNDFFDFRGILLAAGAALAYIIVMGTLSVFIEIHRNLLKIRIILEKYDGARGLRPRDENSGAPERIEPQLRR